MGVKDVERAVRRAVAVLDNEDYMDALHEAGTRYAVIDPILRALGWKLRDPEECRVEEWLELESSWRRADYVLRKDGENVVLIEAKGFNKTRLNGWSQENQLKDLAHGNEWKLGVLTNGQSWYFYKLDGEDPFGEPRAPDVYLSKDTVKESAKELHLKLSRRNVFRRLP